jgi:hypothetical protein
MLSFLLGDLVQKPGTYEDEDDMWRWMIKQYSTYGDPSTGTSKRIYNFVKTQAIPLFQKFYNSVIPQLSTLKGIFQVPTNTSASTASQQSKTPKIQSGGSLQPDCKYPIFYEYRLTSYRNLIEFLRKYNINIQPTTKKVLEHLYLCSYSIHYVKFLTYMLFILNQIEELPKDKQKKIQQIFDKLSLDIQRSLLN